MGNFEKLVVVAVLFVAAVVLAISFNRDGDEVAASDPLSAAERVLEQQDADWAAPRLGESAGDEAAPSLLLNAGGESTPDLVPEVSAAPAGLQPSSFVQPALSLEPQGDPERRILTGTVGLRPSFIDEYMVYTVAAGDTWTSLAQRFYQDGQYTRNLVRANDDLAELTPGNEILVPIYDFFAADAAEADSPLERQAHEVAAELAADEGTPAASSGAARSELAPAGPARTGSAPTNPGAVLEYEVKPGDTLSDISLAVFGTATRWKELLGANSDKLRTPESLQVGMKLAIPEGGKLPVAGAPRSAPSTVAKKPEPKPAVKPAPAASPKKKKVL